MSRTIAVSDDVFDRLERQANARGVTISQMLDELAARAEEQSMSSAVERLRANGLLLDPIGSPDTGTAFDPVEVRGTPLSEVITEERR
jgi:hypothetical protein